MSRASSVGSSEPMHKITLSIVFGKLGELMATPFSTEADALRESLHSSLIEKRSEAGKAWEAFASKRDELAATGTNLGQNGFGLKALDNLHRAYERVDAECRDLEERLLRHVGSGGKGTATPGVDGPLVAGIGRDFLTKLGAGFAGHKALDGTTGGSLVRPFYDPAINLLPQRQLFVRSLLPTKQADGDKVWYLRQTVADQRAAVVPAGEEKPRSVYTVERIEQPIATLAHTSDAVDRSLLSDFDSLVDFLDGQLRLGVLLAEEDQILNGDGQGDNLLGLTECNGIFSLAREPDESNADSLHRGITAVRSAFAEPDAICVNPLDWEQVRLSKSETGEYLSAPIVEADPDRLWGKKVVTSPTIGVGTALVGAFAEGAIWYDRDEARVTFAETGLGDAPGEELYTRNQVRFRAESRGTLAILRPSNFALVEDLGPVVQLS
jgi:HK97 family phage major capsid protein